MNTTNSGHDPGESDGSDRRAVKSVVAAFDVIEKLRVLDGTTVSELSKHVDRSIGTVHTHLATLKAQGYVVQEDNVYRLSPRFVALGEYVRNSSKLYQGAKDEADRLAEETGEVVHLLTEQDGLKIGIYEAFGGEAVGTEYFVRNQGKPKRFLHYSAAGKAILAYLPRERVEDIVARHGLIEKTPNTITDEAELFEELETVRDRGFALNDEEQVMGLRAVGAPIRDVSGAVLGAISLAAPKSRLKDDEFRETVPERVMNSANIININIQTQ
ncbi:MAG: IclR family transcriptional regulator [Salinigranum sp.]